MNILTRIFILCTLYVVSYGHMTHDCGLPELYSVKINSSNAFSSYTAGDINLISFSNYSHVSGDVQGLVIAMGICKLGTVSIGDRLPVTFSKEWPFVCNNLNQWSGGDLYPAGKGYFANSVNLPDIATWLRSKHTGSGIALGDAFNDLRNNLCSLSSLWRTIPQNAQATLSGYSLIVDSPIVSTRYYLTIPASVWNTKTEIILRTDPNAEYVITISGTGYVLFQGGSWPGKPERTVFNIPGERYIKVRGTDVRGSILAACGGILKQTGGVINGNVYVANAIAVLQINILCSMSPPPTVPPTNQEETCPSELNFRLTTDSNEFNKYYTYSFNFISNDDYNHFSGDIEGYAAAADVCNLGAGVSIGERVSTQISLEWVLICHKLESWLNGRLYPDDMSYGIFANEVNPNNIAASILARRTGYGINIKPYFNNLFYNLCRVSQQFIAATTNAFAELNGVKIRITSGDPTASRYYIQIPATTFNAGVEYELVGTFNPNAVYIITITGTEDVLFEGASWIGDPRKTIWNISGSRKINIRGEDVRGIILGPCGATLNQTGGVVNGKVYVSNACNVLQINEIDCPPYSFRANP